MRLWSGRAWGRAACVAVAALGLGSCDSGQPPTAPQPSPTPLALATPTPAPTPAPAPTPELATVTSEGYSASSMSTRPSLVILAAGMGSRYGGLKQLDPMGPSGETLLDYSVFDAVRAGFNRVVFIIRKDIEAEFREKIGARYEGKIAIDYVFQQLDALPDGYATVVGGRRGPTGAPMRLPAQGQQNPPPNPRPRSGA